MKVYFILLLGYSSSLFAAERLSEDMAKALIVRQLLNLIEIQKTVDSVGHKDFRLCSFQDPLFSQTLENHLNGLSVQDRSLKIIDMADRERVIDCDAVFINRPQEANLTWFLNNSMPEKTLFIINGQHIAERGFQIGLYLNPEKTFDFELNPDAFIAGYQVPRPEMLQFGKVLSSEIERKINLMRTLITYTEWPLSEAVQQTQSFNLCALRNKSLEVFIENFTRGKSINSKTLNNRYIDSTAGSEVCDALLIESIQDLDSIRLLTERSHRKLLLIGNQPGLAESGVHYNLSPSVPNGQSFEINLTAFALSGHSPHYDLFNSGRVVESDYPEFSRTLASIIQFTRWPNNTLAAKIDTPIELCVFNDPQLTETLARFMTAPMSFYGLPSNHNIQIRTAEPKSSLDACGALLTGEIDASTTALMSQKTTEDQLLWISSQQQDSTNAAHYRIVSTPKKIILEINREQLDAGGFTPEQNLIDVATLSGGSAQ